MEALRDIPQWIMLLVTIVGGAAGIVLWVTNANAASRHIMRGEMQKMMNSLQEDDRLSESRMNRQLDAQAERIGRVERRLDEIGRIGHSD